ncbi:hypothetical protein BGZ83_005249 [Gryganskiella cystojenkinii]|nr:hypothetical protein BGZ83_005249 [Gryganskiella cystojenkinii]
MDFQDEQEAIAEAIRLSLLEAETNGNGSQEQITPTIGRSRTNSNTGSPSRQRRRPPQPQPYTPPAVNRGGSIIDLTDDLESDHEDLNWARLAPRDQPQPQRAGPSQPALILDDDDEDDEDDDIDYLQQQQEEEDEDLKKALAISLEYAQTMEASVPAKASSSKPPETSTSTLDQTPALTASSSLNSILGISRAEMERQRQERLQKRGSSDSVSATSTSSLTENKKDIHHSVDILEPPRKVPKTVMYSRDRDVSPIIAVSPPAVSSSFASKAASPGLGPGSTLASAASSSSSSTHPKPMSPSSLPSSQGTGKFANFVEAVKEFSKQATSRTKQISASPSKITASNISAPLSYTVSRRAPTTPASPPTPTSASSSSSSSSTPSSSSTTSSTTSYPLRYRRATFFNTLIKGKKQDQHSIQFGDLVDTNHITKAVLTTFQLDPNWLEKYLPPRISQCRFVHWYKEHREQPGFHRVSQNVVEVHPPLNGMGTFHPKLMLLFYKGFCRVVVSSANLVDYDWEKLVNTVFVQDFPINPAGPVDDPEKLGEFGCDLHNYLKVMTAPDQVLRVLLSIDFSSAKTSSLGKLTLPFLTDLDRASKGLEPRVRSRTDVQERRPSIKVIFPTERSVRASKLGEMGAGTICFQQQYWTEPSYPRSVMHDFECVGEMRGSLMHTKAFNKKTIPPPTTTTTKGGKKGAVFIQPKPINDLQISMRNWELGILYPIETEEELESYYGTNNGNTDQSFFGPMPVPYKRPIRPYVAEDTPWFR